MIGNREAGSDARLSFGKDEVRMQPPMTGTAPAGEFLLEMRGIHKTFPGVKALDNARLMVRPHSRRLNAGSVALSSFAARM